MLTSLIENADNGMRRREGILDESKKSSAGKV